MKNKIIGIFEGVLYEHHAKEVDAAFSINVSEREIANKAATRIIEQLGDCYVPCDEEEADLYVSEYMVGAKTLYLKKLPPHPKEEPKDSAEETRAIQKQDDKYHLACQNCGTTFQPLQMIPFRNDNHVVGLLTACDDCKDELYGQRFDRECKFLPDPPTVETKKD